MAEGVLRRVWGLWRSLDGALRSVSDGLRSFLRALNVLRVLAILLFLAVLALAVLLFFFPEWTPYVMVGVLVVLALPLLLAFFVLSLPFRAKSFVRLVRMGYPENAKELTIRLVARKLHEESIESERLLVETAWNETRKLAQRYKERARRLARQLDEMPDAPDGPHAGAGGPPDPRGPHPSDAGDAPTGPSRPPPRS